MSDKFQHQAVKKSSHAAESLDIVCKILSDISDEAPLPKQDSGLDGLVQNLLFAISRRRAWMDWLIDGRSTGRVRPRVRRVLWWALTEIFELNGLPDAVVVDTACNYVHRRYSQSESGFVNGFLRKLLVDKGDGQLNNLSSAPIWVQVGLPEIIWRRWTKILGDVAIQKLGELLQTNAEIACRLRLGHKMPANVDFLRPAKNCDWCPENIAFIKKTGMKNEIPLHDFYIQDPSTLMAPWMMDAKPGEKIADLCSAPGGKSLIMAEMMQGKGLLLCCDKSEKRLARVKENLVAFGNVKYLVEDSCKSGLEDDLWDGVLLDVPCSNTGVIRRRPDVRWRFSEERLAEILEIQADLLDRAAKLVVPAGRIVYSTCSVELEENSMQVEKFLSSHKNFILKYQRQLWPGEDHDGGYAALLVREK